jgi:hypothetical protein
MVTSTSSVTEKRSAVERLVTVAAPVEADETTATYSWAGTGCVMESN